MLNLRRKVQSMADFDPEGSGYDYKTAIKDRVLPKRGHWSSRNPKTGQILKGRKHRTHKKTVKGEKKAGYRIIKGKDGKYYSVPRGRYD